MSEHNETFEEALQRRARLMKVKEAPTVAREFQSGEAAAVQFPKRTNGDPVLSEKTRVVLSISVVITLAAFLIAMGMKYGEWNSERVAMHADIADVQVRVKSLEIRFATLDRTLDRIQANQETEADNIKTLLRHSDALLWTHGKAPNKGNPPKDDE